MWWRVILEVKYILSECRKVWGQKPPLGRVLNSVSKITISPFVSNLKGIDFKIQTVDIEGKKIKLQIWLVLFVLYSNTILLTGTQLVRSDSKQSLDLIIEEQW